MLEQRFNPDQQDCQIGSTTFKLAGILKNRIIADKLTNKKRKKGKNYYIPSAISKFNYPVVSLL